jgi:predicted metallo-beta-lactamase superfamily hydrolase
MEQIIDGKKYSTGKADLVASDRYWDGSNFERSGRNTFLYKTKKGSFFLYHATQWQGEREHIEAITEEEARQYYEQLPEQEMTYSEAFGQEPEEA